MDRLGPARGSWKLCLESEGWLTRPLATHSEGVGTAWLVPASASLVIGRAAELGFHAVHPGGRDPWSAALAVRSARAALSVDRSPAALAWNEAFEREEDVHIRAADTTLREVEAIVGSEQVDRMVHLQIPCDPAADGSHAWKVDLSTWALGLAAGQRQEVVELLKVRESYLRQTWRVHFARRAEAWCGDLVP